MRFVVLAFLWLTVTGFGLMTLCSGFFVLSAPVIAIPFGAVTGLCAYGVFRVIQTIHADDPVAPGESAEPDPQTEAPPKSPP